MSYVIKELNLINKNIHFVGIGGIGMSGIAEVMHNIGYSITGSDISANQLTTRLSNIGVKIFTSHDEENIKNAFVIVVSSAIRSDNPEVVGAKRRGIPILLRAEMLAELMRFKKSVAISGTHGKTTTTSLMASLFETAGLDPTVVNGGILNAYHSNARLGTGEWIIVEADESDGSFTKLHPTFAVVTNIDPEHMEYYKTFDNLKAAFLQFIHNMPFYGVAALCIDHPVVEELAQSITDRRIVTYGFSEKAMVRATNLDSTPQGTTFDIEIYPSQSHFLKHDPKMAVLPRRIQSVHLPMMGVHNVQNSLALVVIANELGLSDSIITNALSSFKGVKRRFTYVAEVHGITIIDDYAHHPVEIKTAIQAAQQACPKGKIIAVLQPHRYTRLRDLFNDFINSFSGASHVIIAPVYAAGESPIDGIDHITLKNNVATMTKLPVYSVNTPDEIPTLITQLAKSGDVVLMMGAGNITQWATALPTAINDIMDNNHKIQQSI